MSDERKNQVTRIVGELGGKLGRFVRARVRSDSEAEDVLQDVWHRLITALDAGAVEQIGAWLYTVARNRIIDRARKPKMASLDALAEDAADAAFEFPAGLLRDDQTPATEYRRMLFWERLHAALAELPPEQRQVFVWHELEGLSFQEIGALTGENQNTLLSRKRYAVLHLRRQLGNLRDEFLP
ncbi:MAG: RNA polymerase sigma factor [Verrucomicrobia bacterium]|nr:RNA polymerase sigma factor [Verrucomicrobiota bacterium]